MSGPPRRVIDRGPGRAEVAREKVERAPATWAQLTVNACSSASTSRSASASYLDASTNLPSWARLMASQHPR